jgi:transcriptional regulator with XRE-family HTH domain
MQTDGFTDIAAFVNMLANYRRDRGFTQAQVAKRMGTTQPAIAKIETHKVTPSAQALARYCRAIDCYFVVTLDMTSGLVEEEMSRTPEKVRTLHARLAEKASRIGALNDPAQRAAYSVYVTVLNEMEELWPNLVPVATEESEST